MISAQSSALSLHTQHLDDVKPDDVVNEAVQQIAFADKILLNKLDLVTDEQKRDVVKRIKVRRRAGCRGEVLGWRCSAL